ncbi:hypothetical protein CHS0354_012764 [Potamilus streckersoni]|uniref:Cysteine and tyrosine-rich protein 1 n=1 Tax=Potamilus streckersoni TaxID=2493646 RepID=A0AAE0RV60_9BIVA|nr:hypothetical protein CHS0354_012764 [Potamilus streckersoni]
MRRKTTSSVDAEEYCTYSNSYTYLYRWCDYGCCGDKYDSYDDVCCSSSNDGVIAGSVVGGVIFLGIMIGVIICCVQSHNRNKGVIIHPVNGPQTVVVQGTTAAQGYPQLHYGAYPGPPCYPGQVSSTTVITS